MQKKEFELLKKLFEIKDIETVVLKHGNVIIYRIDDLFRLVNDKNEKPKARFSILTENEVLNKYFKFV